jgi:hypothetical protein
MTSALPSSFGLLDHKVDDAMPKSRFSPTRDTRHDLEIVFPGSGVWTCRILSGLAAASEAALWLMKIGAVFAFVGVCVLAQFVWAIVGRGFSRGRSRRRW